MYNIQFCNKSNDAVNSSLIGSLKGGDIKYFSTQFEASHIVFPACSSYTLKFSCVKLEVAKHDVFCIFGNLDKNFKRGSVGLSNSRLRFVLCQSHYIHGTFM